MTRFYCDRCGEECTHSQEGLARVHVTIALPEWTAEEQMKRLTRGRVLKPATQYKHVCMACAELLIPEFFKR